MSQAPRPSAKPTRRPDRAATEAALRDAAVRLLERDGVLAGLSLQEVADEAGVNRGLIHHYFGSRQALLRAALDARKAQVAPAFARSLDEPPQERTTMAVKAHRRDTSFARMVMLLALDGDEDFEPIPYLEERLAAFDDEIAKGFWDADADPIALTVIWDVILDGYFTLREPMARQLGMATGKLDARVMTAIAQLFSAVLRPATSSDRG